jgi:hypothetical protein
MGWAIKVNNLERAQEPQLCSPPVAVIIPPKNPERLTSRLLAPGLGDTRVVDTKSHEDSLRLSFACRIKKWIADLKRLIV